VAAFANEKFRGDIIAEETVEEEPYPKRKEAGSKKEESGSKTKRQEERGGGTQHSQTRIKTIQQKEIRELKESVPTYDTEIQDIRIAKPFRTNGLNCHTIEALLQYIGLTTEDNTTEVMDKLSKKQEAGATSTKEKKEQGRGQFKK